MLSSCGPVRTLPHGPPRPADARTTQARPYWWDEVELPQPAPAPLPADGRRGRGGRRVHGAGGRAGARPGGAASVVVLDRDDIGAGASSRNGGMAHPGGKRDLPEFLAEPGGRRLWDETVAAFEGVGVARPPSSASNSTGSAAAISSWPTTPVRRRPDGRWPTPTPRSARRPASSTPPSCSAEIGSDQFFGGLLVERSAGLHPAKLAAGLARAAAGPGAELHGATTVLAVERTARATRSKRPGAPCECGEVVVATNGTTDRRLVPWLGRRVLGIGSYMIATEPLDARRGGVGQPPRADVLRHQELPALLAPVARRPARPLRRPDVALAHHRGAVPRPALRGHGPRPSAAGRGRGSTAPGEARWRSPPTASRTWAVIPAPASCTPWGIAAAVWRCPIHFGRAVGRWLCGRGDLPAVRRPAVAGHAVARPCPVAVRRGGRGGSGVATRWAAERSGPMTRARSLIRRRWRRTRRRRRRSGRCGPPRVAPTASTAPRCPGS